MAVYFVKAKGLNRVKIGYTSSNDPKTRINQLKTSCADNLELVKFYPDVGRETEKKFHERFKDCHINREWFHYRPAISDFIGDCNLDKPILDEGPEHIVGLQDRADIAGFRISMLSMNKGLSPEQCVVLRMALKFALLSGEEDLCLFLDSTRAIIGDTEDVTAQEMDYLKAKRRARSRRISGHRRTQQGSLPTLE